MDAQSFGSFQEAARHVLDFLKARLGFDLWMVARTSDDDWVVLGANDGSYGVDIGHLFRWQDSFCSRMVTGAGPRFAPFAKDVPIYNAAPIGQQVNIGAYIGVPLRDENGNLFGTLCAINPQPMPGIDGEIEMPLVELCGHLLATIINVEMRASESRRSAERVEVRGLIDPLTGCLTRDGFDRILALEEKRCVQFGNPAHVLVIDMDDFKALNEARGRAEGDLVLQRVAVLLGRQLDASDALARIDGDGFAVLLMNCNDQRFESIHSRLIQDIADEGFLVSLSDVKRHPGRGLAAALETALNQLDLRQQAELSGQPTA